MPIENRTRTTHYRLEGALANGDPDPVAPNTQVPQTIGPIIPIGKVVRILKFGGSDGEESGSPSYVYLQWGSAGAFKNVRVFPLRASSHTEVVMRDFVGDGVKRLRIVRENTSGVSRAIFAWIEVARP